MNAYCNPRAVIGANHPPGAIELAKPTITELGQFLSDHPVIVNDDEARAAHEIKDRADRALKGVENERDGKTRPLNEQVKTLNLEYHHWHNTDKKRPGLWDAQVAELMIRLDVYARKLKAAQDAARKAAREAAEAAARKAQEAEEAAWRARDEAEAGVCDVDIAGAIEEAKTASDAAFRTGRIAARADKAKVRIGGAIGKVLSFKNKEVLAVGDWQAAIEEMGMTDGIAEAILTAARNYKRAFGDYPAGITVTHEERL